MTERPPAFLPAEGERFRVLPEQSPTYGGLVGSVETARDDDGVIRVRLAFPDGRSAPFLWTEVERVAS